MQNSVPQRRVGQPTWRSEKGKRGHTDRNLQIGLLQEDEKVWICGIIQIGSFLQRDDRISTSEPVVLVRVFWSEDDAADAS